MRVPEDQTIKVVDDNTLPSEDIEMELEARRQQGTNTTVTDAMPSLKAGATRGLMSQPSLSLPLSPGMCLMPRARAFSGYTQPP